MPFSTIATGEFASVVFKPTNNAAWVSFTPRPGFNAGALADAIVDGTPLIIHMIDASTGYFAYASGQAYGFDDTHIVSASTVILADLTITTDQGQVTPWAKDASNVVYTLDPTSQLVHSYPVALITSLKAFLP